MRDALPSSDCPCQSNGRCATDTNYAVSPRYSFHRIVDDMLRNVYKRRVENTGVEIRNESLYSTGEADATRAAHDEG
jgi:hypothetical protein